MEKKGEPILPAPYFSLTREKWEHLLNVATFQEAATAWIQAKRMLNVYTGEIMAANIALSDERIAYVGEKTPKIDDRTLIIDAGDLLLVPGYIEPHAHPYQLYNPVTFSEFALRHGTATIINDNLPFMLNLAVEQMEAFMDELTRLPVKNFWWCRLDPQSSDAEMQKRFRPEIIERLMNHPLVLQGGEFTAWKGMLDGDGEIRGRMYAAWKTGKRIETHNPGSSAETLSAVAAAGVTGCHESITAEEAMRRIRLGLTATLRHSSIRPDLPELIKGLLKEPGANWNRMMLTTDGSTPFFLKGGFIDELIGICIESGLPAAEAYRLASLNPAVYYGLDRDLGAIAPGKWADINFVEDVTRPEPVHVMAGGKMFVKDKQWTCRFPDIVWEKLGIASFRAAWKSRPEWFAIQSAAEKFPVVELMNAAITLQRNENLPAENGEITLRNHQGYLYAAQVDKDGEWITKGIVKGFGHFDALASSYTITQDFIVLGRDREQMAAALNRVLEMGGGICLFDKGKPAFELPLPLQGGMSDRNMDVLIENMGRFIGLLRDKGYVHEDPVYSILFLTATHLPQIRFTRRGICAVKSGNILWPSEPIGQ